jgi:cation diffusion facilitator CzcD-associated flavoprotein CzcO
MGMTEPQPQQPQPQPQPQQRERHCIVGAGPGGLAAARAFMNLGLEVDVFERHHEIGGIWSTTNPGTPMYESAHFISSRDESAYLGFAMPKTFPDYPRHDQILSYVQSFAKEFGIDRHVHLSTSVERATYDGSHWVVTTSDGQTNRYRTLTCASGTQWFPSTPSFPGVETFTGQTMHSQQFKSGKQFDGLRVLVVGAGNSGVDIACDAARFAKFAAISVRRGYHLIPKHILGMPADEFGNSGPHLPMSVAQRVFPKLLRIVMGDPTKYGWPKPDHKLFESHPIVNDQILHHLRHGDLEVRRDIERFDGPDVVFKDGRREQFDLVVFATGYQTRVPYLDDSVFPWRGGRPSLYLRLFSPTHSGLAAIGFTEGDGGAYELFDNMADLIARSALAAERNPQEYSQLQALFAKPSPDVSGGVKHVSSDRHAAYVNLHAYQKAVAAIRKEFQWPPLSATTFDHLRTNSVGASVS